MIAEVNGISLNYDDEGEGEPVLLIAGFGSNRHFWKGMVPLLEGCRLIMPDNRGVGKTVYSGPFTMEDLADDCYELVRSLGLEKVHVVGWYMGSLIAQVFAAKHPEATKTLTMVSTYVHRPARSAYMLENMVQLAIDGKATLDALYVAVNAFCYPEHVFRDYEQKGIAVPVPRRPMDPRQLMDQLRAVDGFRATDVISKITAPSMVVQGTADMMTDFSEGEAVYSHIKGCKIVPVMGEGHNVPPEEYYRDLLTLIRDNS